MLVLVLCDDGVAGHVLRVTDEWGTDRERLDSPSQARCAPPPPRCLLITSSTQNTKPPQFAENGWTRRSSTSRARAPACSLQNPPGTKIQLRDFTFRFMCDSWGPLPRVWSSAVSLKRNLGGGGGADVCYW